VSPGTFDANARARIVELGFPDPGLAFTEKARRRRALCGFTVAYPLPGDHGLEVCTKSGQTLYMMIEGIRIPRGWANDPAAWIRKLTEFVETAKPGQMLSCGAALIVRESPSHGAPR
jgi:hypothetical protein